ncbi:hypothetical protein MG293_014796 [Ovis ammon polii]|uniref:Solute carrier organic anion transporter family member 3A1 n=1 Tax=Ovis ammon polii TaxID=230172 RepID=A0AAD4Y2S6_OVIAM|nr:hypothetical protein MG293_014796 [Ovis ammon polii]
MQAKKPGGSSGGGRSGELQGDEAQRNKKKKKKVSCFSNIKIFLVSECALMLAQGTVGAYLNTVIVSPLPSLDLLPVSVLTTLERRFNLQSADVGVIASSFEIGNLALILFVSYFGARGHRPRLIGCGGIVMALGALLSALPEFLTHQYKYEAGEIRWGAEGRDVCAANGSGGDQGPDPDLICRSRTATNMMYLLLIGAQVLLGIGATPVQPLGVSYIDDHVRRKDSSLYIELWTVYSHLAVHSIGTTITIGKLPLRRVGNPSPYNVPRAGSGLPYGSTLGSGDPSSMFGRPAAAECQPRMGREGHLKRGSSVLGPLILT